MQITLTLSSKNDIDIILPIAANSTIQGLIYNMLKADGFYSHILHEEGNRIAGKSYKLFTFSEIKGRYIINDKKIIYKSDISLEIRSVAPYFIQLLFSYFSQNKLIHLGDNVLEITNVKIEDKKILNENIIIKTLSPITAYITNSDGHTVYYSPKEQRFYDLIINNAKRKMQSYFKTDKDFELEITPRQNTQFVKRATKFKDTFITAWHGEFHLTGTLETLNFLYETGLGSKNSQGFGMFQVLD